MVFMENLHILSIGFQCHVPIHFHAKNGQFYSSTNNLAILKSECPIITKSIQAVKDLRRNIFYSIEFLTIPDVFYELDHRKRYVVG